MQLNYYIIDVFTENAFDGAQIAVFPQADGLEKTQMQLLARELNLSETAFVFSADSSGKRRMRIFTPYSEIDFAGHPIIAVGYALVAEGELTLQEPHTPLTLEQNIGVIEANISQQDGKATLVQFSRQTKPTIDRFVPVDKDIASTLSLKEEDLDNSNFKARMVYTDQAYLIVPMKSYQAVRKAKFNYVTWSQSIASMCMAKEILLFTKESDIAYSNFHARLLGPEISLKEDPPIASAMPAFTAYLCDHEHIKQGTHTFAIDRGQKNTRKSVLNIEMDHKGEDILTLRVGGPAVIISEGKISLPE